MARRDHYKTLGVPPDSTTKTIKARYRELARQFHPDVNKEPGAADKFRELTESYQLLCDPNLRGHYDALRKIEQDRRRPPPPPKPEPKRRPPPKQAPSTRGMPDGAREGVAAAQRLFAQGRLTEVERVAQALIRSYPRLGIAYALLGDVCRTQQKWDRAAKMYALAIQFDPSDPSYERRYEQILDEMRQAKTVAAAPDEHELRRRQRAAGISMLVHPPFLFYVAFVQGDRAHLPSGFEYLTWVFILALFLDGAACGIALTVTGQLARWESLGSHGGRFSSAAWYGLASAVQFWAALVLYGVMGVLQDSFHSSLSRVFGWCAGLTVLFALLFSLQQPHGFQQAFIWGGNLLFLGTLAGWRLADVFRG